MTQGKKSHTPENSTSECLFQCSENHCVKKIKKTTLENPVTSQPRSELKNIYTTKTHSVWPWNTFTEWMEGSRKSHRRNVVSREEVTTSRWVGCVQQCVSSWSCPVGDGGRSHSEAPTRLLGKAVVGTVCGVKGGPMSLPLVHSKELNEQCGRDTPDCNG